MPIIYGVVARGTTVLAEHRTTTGNFTTIALRILEKIPPQECKLSYIYDKYLFHYVKEDALTYMCMADDEFGRRVPFVFLDDIKNRFRATYGDNDLMLTEGEAEGDPLISKDKGKTAIAYAMNEDFSKIMQKQMEYYSSSPDADNLRKVRGEIDEVKKVMMLNIEKILDRGEKLELLVDKTDQLSQNAFKMKMHSTQLRKAMCWKNVKTTVLLCLLVTAVILVIVMMSCGGFTFPDCR
eukprot:gnl/Hemi2/2737_TR960_c0_g1_i2.p1 gnl/Hemi2/2737_TR960_c0_g1~~gnl/Hemi2/2737_TR960_c0_g1_i2.p1  ORF type:complete len:238 (+),score=72.17 gnl/Hemi2/2737_TR960_c0_g1_i2:143-856(+)